MSSDGVTVAASGVMRLHSFAFFGSSLLLTVAVAAGCATPSEDQAASSEAAINTSSPIAPVDLASCWVKPDATTTDAFFQRHEVHCKLAVLGDYPLVPQTTIVEVQTARDRYVHGEPKAEDTVIGSLTNDDFPLRVRTRFLFPPTTSTGDAFGLKDERVIRALPEATAEKPLVYKSPFKLWGVEITSKDGTPLYVSGRYTVTTGSYKSGYNFTIPDTDKSELGVNLFNEGKDGRAELALIAPANGPITLSVYGKNVEVAGPGAYVFDGEKLTKQAGVPAREPEPGDLTPPPAPTCGGDGQAKCPSGACAVGHRLVADRCKACGGQGQTWCGEWDAKTCNPAFRLVGDLCTACGTAGKTWCGAWDAKTCDAGLRLVGDLCTPCGGAGQTWCGEWAKKTCNDGHRLVGDLCTPCGAEGQTWCGDWDAKTCNAGLRVVGDRCGR